MPTKPKAAADLRARVRAKLIEALKASDPDCYIEHNDKLGTQIDGWFKLDQVVDAVIAECGR